MDDIEVNEDYASLLQMIREDNWMPDVGERVQVLFTESKENTLRGIAAFFSALETVRADVAAGRYTERDECISATVALGQLRRSILESLPAKEGRTLVWKGGMEPDPERPATHLLFHILARYK
jgi:hypothetical protein